MNEYDIILLIVGIAVFVFAVAYIFVELRFADNLIYKADKMRKWAKGELDKRKEEEKDENQNN
jgi:hypothetical protein